MNSIVLERVLMRVTIAQCILMASLLVGCTKAIRTDDPVAYRPAKAAVTQEEAVRNISSPVFFAYDEAKLSAESIRALDDKARVLIVFPQLQIVIEGYCDERGSQAYNLALGERRAKAVYDYFVERGVDPVRLHMISYGRLHPFKVGKGEQAWSYNRRVELSVYANSL